MKFTDHYICIKWWFQVKKSNFWLISLKNQSSKLILWPTSIIHTMICWPSYIILWYLRMKFTNFIETIQNKVLFYSHFWQILTKKSDLSSKLILWPTCIMSYNLIWGWNLIIICRELYFQVKMTIFDLCANYFNFFIQTVSWSSYSIWS